MRLKDKRELLYIRDRSSRIERPSVGTKRTPMTA